MMLSRFTTLLLGLTAALAVTACQEDLTTPGSCPGTCPGGTPQVFDTIITPLAGLDSSFRGYVGKSEGSAVLLSNGLPAAEARAWYVYVRRPDTLNLNGLPQLYTIDSLRIDVTLVARDTAVKGLTLFFHRIARTVDSTTPFADVEAQLTAATLVDSIVVPDSVRNGTVTRLLTGADLDRMAIAPEDSGQVALGLRMTANKPTGVRLSAFNGGNTLPSFTTFARGVSIATDTGRVTTPAERTGFVLQNPNPPDDPDVLHIGGFPSSRALIRFRVPARLVDSVTIVRATLELTPQAPFRGLPGDRTDLVVWPVVTDLGAKSLVPVGFTPPGVQIVDGTTNAVMVDVLRVVAGWSGNATVHGILVQLTPEAATFLQPAFRSTRALTGQPRLRLTYVIPPKQERP